MAWELDTAHALIEFSVKHMMISTVKGRFNTFSGTIELDENAPINSRVDVTIDVNSIDTNAEARDNHLRSPDFFDVAQFPTITYKSTRVEETGTNKFRIYGDLTIRNVTREVVLEAEAEGPVKDMRGGRRVAFSLTGAINRKDFGLEWNVALESGGWLVGEQIKISIEVPAVEPVATPA